MQPLSLCNYYFKYSLYNATTDSTNISSIISIVSRTNTVTERNAISTPSKLTLGVIFAVAIVAGIVLISSLLYYRRFHGQVKTTATNSADPMDRLGGVLKGAERHADASLQEFFASCCDSRDEDDRL